ncbi:hypothetical protein MESS2_1620018 [Mesorhizobium metallidurans STM 2683]|uniref:Uncharacterized protein n=1 Tax=Mesorhizobium metallidurans STM 2683 TaxID=1297569 RepID=M5ENA9_9HYPH|nr:hypothetical protein MESS2_1620018 [Mesorhizobium metallidurans STM 2683]
MLRLLRRGVESKSQLALSSSEPRRLKVKYRSAARV